jgi:hypothetical protein
MRHTIVEKSSAIICFAAVQLGSPSRRKLLACALWLFILVSSAPAQFDDDPIAEPESAQTKKVFAAIELAKMAAEANQPDVSFEAIKRAAATGPVISKVDLGGLLSSPQQNSSIMSGYGSNTATPLRTAANKAAAKMIEVNELWVKKNFDASLALAVWFDHVFPKDSPNTINIHSQTPANANRVSYSSFSIAGSSAKPLKTNAHCLIDWAIKVDKLAVI